MSEKTLKRLLAAVAGLLAAYGIVYAFGLLGGREVETELGAMLSRLAPADIQEVRIVGPNDTLRLERAGAAAWTVNGFAADSASVERLWSSLTATRVAQLVAENPANHARMGVTADGASSVEFHTAGGSVTRLLVGNTGPMFPSLYARLPDDDRVYLLTGNLRSQVMWSLAEWRDKTIVRVDTARVREIGVQRDGRRYVIRRAEAGWTVDGGPANEGPVRTLLQELAHLQASGFLADTASLGNAPRSLLVLGAANDTLAHLTVGSPDGINFRLRAGARPEVYDLPSWRADQLAPTRESVASP
ncbi:MAG: DUF4340 domain-containing protein [Gemmatimonadetes bacterium]|nr:DUF4340 domain-containing protein [Gemmatimonadota bacterium]